MDYKEYIFSNAWFWSTLSLNLEINQNKNKITKPYFLNRSFSAKRRSNSARIVVWVFFKCCMCWTALKREWVKDWKWGGNETYFCVKEPLWTFSCWDKSVIHFLIHQNHLLFELSFSVPIEYESVFLVRNWSSFLVASLSNALKMFRKEEKVKIDRKKKNDPMIKKVAETTWYHNLLKKKVNLFFI